MTRSNGMGSVSVTVFVVTTGNGDGELLSAEDVEAVAPFEFVALDRTGSSPPHADRLNTAMNTPAAASRRTHARVW